jgi:hypothetical protein
VPIEDENAMTSGLPTAYGSGGSGVGSDALALNGRATEKPIAASRNATREKEWMQRMLAFDPMGSTKRACGAP